MTSTTKLTATQTAVLDLLATNGPMVPVSILEALDTKMVAVRATTASLAKRGLITQDAQTTRWSLVTPPAPAAKGARTWDASTATTHVCAGACAQELPATAYPTTGKPGQRGVVCRKDRDAARAAR